MNLCESGMFQCAFELVFGVGLAVIAMIFFAVMTVIAAIATHKKGGAE